MRKTGDTKSSSSPTFPFQKSGFTIGPRFLSLASMTAGTKTGQQNCSSPLTLQTLILPFMLLCRITGKKLFMYKFAFTVLKRHFQLLAG